MTALSITVAEVQPGAEADGAVFSTGIAGATITAGQALYLDALSNTLKLAQCDGALAEAACVGIALHGALAGQPVKYQSEGPITTGATAAATVGTVYCVAAAAGSITPNADIASTNFVSILGVGKTAAIINLKRNNSAIAKA